MNSGEEHPSALFAFRSKKGSKQESKCAPQMSQHWTIGSGGMVCGSCAVHSEKALQKLPGVSSTSLILGRPPGSAQQLGLDDHAKKTTPASRKLSPNDSPANGRLKQTSSGTPNGGAGFVPRSHSTLGNIISNIITELWELARTLPWCASIMDLTMANPRPAPSLPVASGCRCRDGSTR